jgi:hypothetical protein
MSKKITDTAQDTDLALEKPIFVQLRLPAALAAKLRTEGAPARRKLPAQIIHRLERGAEADAMAYGWIDPERNKTLGDALGVLAWRIEEAAPMSGDSLANQGTILAMLKIAIANLFDRLGANDEGLSSDEKAYAGLISRQFINELRRPESGLRSYGPRPDLDIIAKLAKAWSIEGKKAGQ